MKNFIIIAAVVAIIAGIKANPTKAIGNYSTRTLIFHLCCTQLIVISFPDALERERGLFQDLMQGATNALTGCKEYMLCLKSGGDSLSCADIARKCLSG